MTIQKEVFLVFTVMFLIIVSVFFLVFLSSVKSGELQNVNRKRAIFFFIAFGTVLLVLGISLPKSPYFLYAKAEPAQKVFVVAKQFSFSISKYPIKTEDDFMMSAGIEISVPANEVIEFNVSSWDVNHGFSLYKEGVLMAQVQAMPGYVNRLRWRFKDSGKYDILCLEYCGVAHAAMAATIIVE
jgi:cytochrome c oxidase subunit 2